MTTLADVIDAAEALWPAHLAEDWDVVGLAVGDREQEVSTVLFALDPCDATITEAQEIGADLLFTHHPLLMRGVTSLATDTLKGQQVARLIGSRIAQFNAHTNADSALGGVNDVLAGLLGLRDTRPLDDPRAEEPVPGLGRIGELAQPMSLRDLAEHVATALPAAVQGVRVAGEPDREVRRVAVLGGSGDSLFAAVRAAGADVYITSDLRHHPAAEAMDTAQRAGRDGAPALIDTAHWASESVWLPVAADQLAAELRGRGHSVDCQVSQTRTEPWSFRIDRTVR